MVSEFIDQRNGGYYVAGTRISLDSVVYSFNRGNSQERIQSEYPLLKLPQIFGAVSFYLDHKIEIDQYLARSAREFDANTVPLEQVNPMLWAKLQNARSKMSQP